MVSAADQPADKQQSSDHEPHYHDDGEDFLGPSTCRFVDALAPVQFVSAARADDPHAVMSPVAGLSSMGFKHPKGLAGVDLATLAQFQSRQHSPTTVTTCHMSGLTRLVGDVNSRSRLNSSCLTTRSKVVHRLSPAAAGILDAMLINSQIESLIEKSAADLNVDVEALKQLERQLVDLHYRQTVGQIQSAAE